MTLSLPGAVEAILFATGEAISRKRLGELLGVSDDMLEEALVELRAREGGLALIETGTDIELRTAPGAADLIKKLRESELARDLGKAGLEALAVVLYQKEGATRGDIDWVRGVNSTAALRSLLLRGLIERTEDTGDKRRARYYATVDALAHLGVSRAEDLPRYEEFGNALLARDSEPTAAPEEITHAAV
jgi:segregation and condensation protein B